MLVMVCCLLFADQAWARKWTDDTGRFTIDAEFVQVLNGKARLRKVSGVIIGVPLERLSKTDVDHIRLLLAKKRPLPVKNGAGTRIEQALAAKTRLEFIKTPLVDVIDFLQDLHRIPIVVLVSMKV